MQLSSKLKALLSGSVNDLRTAIVTAAFALIGLGGLIAYAENLWAILQLSAPIWELLSLAVLASILTRLVLSRRTYKPFLFDEVEFKWKVHPRDNGGFSVNKIPYCKEHDLQLISVNNRYMCPEVLCSKCKSRILEWDDIALLLSIATSKVDSHVGRYKTKI